MPNLTVAEAADKINVDARTVRRWCEDGRLQATKFGHVWSIDPDVLGKFERPKKGRPFKSPKGQAGEPAEGIE